MILKKLNVEKIVIDEAIAEKMASIGWEKIEQPKEDQQEERPKKSRKKNTEGAN